MHGDVPVAMRVAMLSGVKTQPKSVSFLFKPACISSLPNVKDSTGVNDDGHHLVDFPSIASTRTTPIASTGDEPSLCYPGTGAASVDRLTLFAKNCRSLKSDDRVEELIRELDSTNWDAILLSETWREAKREYWETAEGHIFIGAGWAENSRGVAILLRSKWKGAVADINYASERALAIDLRSKTLKLRLISVYFPHGKYPDFRVQELYSTLHELKEEAGKKRLSVVIAGDFNAEVGMPSSKEDVNCLGQFGLERVNARGLWLKHWVEVQDMVIANTVFDKTEQHRGTFLGPDKIIKQLDYFLISRQLRGQLLDSQSTNAVDLGSDHRAIKMVISTSSRSRQRKKRKKTTDQRSLDYDPETMKMFVVQKLDGILLDARIDQRIEQIEAVIIEAAEASRRSGAHIAEVETEHQLRLARLIAERKLVPACNSGRRCELSKEIKREIGRIHRQAARKKVGQILEKFTGLKQIAGVKSRRRRTYITDVQDNDGKVHTDRQTIADVFADFYASLYSKDSTSESPSVHNMSEEISPFSLAEVEREVKQMKRGKAKDGAGLAGEMIKDGGHFLLQTLVRLFNEVLRPDAEPPSKWKASLVTVIFKDGDPALPSNYRPITIIPILYKLFSRLLRRRLEPILDAEQSEDQAGFRRGFKSTSTV